MIDSLLIFSDKQAVTETCDSENIVYLGKREIAFGKPVPLEILINEDFNNLTSLTVTVQTDENENMEAAKDLVSATLVADDLKAGKKIPIAFMPAGNMGYVKLKYTVDGSAPDKGKISAYISDGAQQSYHNKI